MRKKSKNEIVTIIATIILLNCDLPDFKDYAGACSHQCNLGKGICQRSEFGCDERLWGGDGLLAGVGSMGLGSESILRGGVGALLELADADIDKPKNKLPEVSL